MKKTILLLGLAATAALAPASRAAEPQIIDDWRKVGPPELGETPRAKGTLSPGAAAALVAAIDQAWRGGQPLHARGDAQEWVIENLRFAFQGQDGRERPPAMGPPEAEAAARALLRRVDVLGVRLAGAHRLLIADVHVAFYVPAGGYEPATLGIVLDERGKVLDLGILAWTFGDGGQADVRSVQIVASALRLTETRTAFGNLCREGDAEGECTYTEGATIDVDVSPTGRFVETSRRPLNLGGQFVDRATDEEIRIEDAGREGMLVTYRAKAGIPWKAMKLLSADPTRRALTARFERAPVTYTLTIAADGKSLVSAGPAGGKPQRLQWIGLQERWRRDGNR